MEHREKSGIQTTTISSRDDDDDEDYDDDDKSSFLVLKDLTRADYRLIKDDS